MESFTQLIGLIALGAVALAIILGLGVFGGKARDDKVAHGQRQRAAVDATHYQSRALFNASERKIFKLLRAAIEESGALLFVMSQTSMGAMLRTGTPRRDGDGREGYDAINSKRVDFAIIDESGRVVLVVEFDGPSHMARDAAIRDDIKTEALRKAEIPLLRIDYRRTDVEKRSAIRRAIEEALR